MYSEAIKQLNLGPNGLPYSIPIHPNLVHLTLGLFIIGIAFDVVGVFFTFEKPIFKYLAIPATRSNFFDVGWYNMLGATVITFFTVGAGFYEMLLVDSPPEIESVWGLNAIDTMLWHGVGGVFLLGLIVAMTVWRGFQRYVWRNDTSRQVQWRYLLAGVVIMFLMYVHGTLGAQLAAEFSVHNTAGHLLRMGQNPNMLLR
ncbi:DUF2231 domain-containing protein [Pleurocapsa sp. PCC 7319]|uniref:DUF2231 domain-containing protein n=1 Tax=Pleurocapsa sp. PCC 7319 TaxID=118161 RepID=UPI0003456376|nr:DUF2231 domain-containing protein [Pleurocapsa sp. PCC 7319]